MEAELFSFPCLHLYSKVPPLFVQPAREQLFQGTVEVRYPTAPSSQSGMLFKDEIPECFAVTEQTSKSE